MGDDGKADGEGDKGGMWLKFRDTKHTRDGEPRTFYVMKKPAKNNVSWDHIYNAGAVYGWDSLEQDPSTGSWKLKDDKKIYTPKIITLNEEDYVVRLLRGRSNYDGPINVSSWKEAQGSEWNRSIVAVTRQYRGENDSMEKALKDYKVGNGQYKTYSGSIKYVNNDLSFKNQTAEYNWFGDLTLGTYQDWKYDYEDENGDKKTANYKGFNSSFKGQWSWTQEQDSSGSDRAFRGNYTDLGAASSGGSSSSNVGVSYGLRLVLEPLSTDN